MYLIYTDESGTNSNSSSPYSLYGGLAVHESIISKFEIQIVEIIQEFLDVDNMLDVEIHFTDIFNYIFYNRKPTDKNKQSNFMKSVFSKIEHKTTMDIIDFINELFQLIQKANVTFLFCFVDKRKDFHNDYYLKNKEISYNAYTFKGFINLLDNFLTKEKESGLLVADGFVDQLPRHLRKLPFSSLISDETIKNNPNVKEIIYKRVLAESLVWKNKFMSSFISSNKIAPLQYKFESHTFNIIDHINFISSKDSIINQVSDILLFVFRKILEYRNSPEHYEAIKELVQDKKLIETLDFIVGKSVQPVTISINSSGNIEIFYIPENIFNQQINI